MKGKTLCEVFAAENSPAPLPSHSPAPVVGHTPVECWCFDEDTKQIVIADPKGRYHCAELDLADVAHAGAPYEEALANARLIAQAPALLAQNEQLRAALAEIIEGAVKHSSCEHRITNYSLKLAQKALEAQP